MSAQELLARLTDELPDIDPVVPVAFLYDELLPTAIAPVEPAAFALDCMLAVWGRDGLKN